MEQVRSAAAENEHNRQLEKRNLLFLFILLLAIAVFPLFSPHTKNGPEMLVWEEDRMILSFSENETYPVCYDQIINLSLVENPNFGTCISGRSDRTLRYGQWENDTLGTYILYASQSFTPVIQIETVDRIYWIGIESKETTESLYKHLMVILLQRETGVLTPPSNCACTA